MTDMQSKHFTYIDHSDGCQNHIVFECDANSITVADECYEKTQGTHPSKQSWVGVTIERATTMTMNDRDIRICDNKGFHLDLLNGVTVSVQLGPGNYCDSDVSNANFDAPKKAIDSDEHWGSNTAECAAYVTGSNLAWIAVPGYTDVGGDDVCGYMNVSQVIDFINVASRLTGFAAEAEPDWAVARKKGDHGDSHGDYRDDPKLQRDELDAMDEFAAEEEECN